MEKVIVIGGGGHAKVLISLIKSIEHYVVIGYSDIIDKGVIIDVPYLGDDNQIIELHGGSKTNLVLGIGGLKEPQLRPLLAKKFVKNGFKFPNIISKESFISSSIIIGDGSVVLTGSVINIDTMIGKFAILNTSSSIDHDCQIGDFVNIGPGSTICGGVRIDPNVIVGAGSTVIQNIHICSNCIVGAGAVVINDIIDSGTYIGIPAKRIK